MFQFGVGCNNSMECGLIYGASHCNPLSVGFERLAFKAGCPSPNNARERPTLNLTSPGDMAIVIVVKKQTACQQNKQLEKSGSRYRKKGSQ